MCFEFVPKKWYISDKNESKKKVNNVTLVCAYEQPQAQSDISYTYSQSSLNTDQSL